MSQQEIKSQNSIMVLAPATRTPDRHRLSLVQSYRGHRHLYGILKKAECEWTVLVQVGLPKQKSILHFQCRLHAKKPASHHRAGILVSGDYHERETPFDPRLVRILV